MSCRPQGYAWEVSISPGSGAPSMEPHHAPGPERSKSRLANEQKAETIGRQAAELEAARARIAALEAAQSPVAASQSAETVGATTEPSPRSEPLSGPWWRRWRAWLAAGAVLVVLGSASCQASGSVKHAGLCAVARATMGEMRESASGQAVTSERFWSAVQSAVDTASKVC